MQSSRNRERKLFSLKPLRLVSIALDSALYSVNMAAASRRTKSREGRDIGSPRSSFVGKQGGANKTKGEASLRYVCVSNRKLLVCIKTSLFLLFPSPLSAGQRCWEVAHV